MILTFGVGFSLYGIFFVGSFPRTGIVTILTGVLVLLFGILSDLAASLRRQIY